MLDVTQHAKYSWPIRPLAAEPVTLLHHRIPTTCLTASEQVLQQGRYIMQSRGSGASCLPVGLVRTQAGAVLVGASGQPEGQCSLTLPSGLKILMRPDLQGTS